MKTLSYILLCLAALCSGRLSAAQINDLYLADVPAVETVSEWQQEAFRQVLSKVTGQPDMDKQPQIAEELRRAAGYIKQFEAVRSADGNRMRVLLDASKVNKLLQQHNIAVWGALRPDILLWLVQQQGSQRQFVRQSEHPLNLALQQTFSQSALPLMLPLYDIDDLLNLSETDVWAGFWQPINQASARYNADVVVVATVEQMQLDGLTTHRLSWQRQDDNRVLRDELTADSEERLMQAFTGKLAQQLAGRYATVLSQTQSQFVLQVNGLSDFAAIVQVQKLLQQLVGVSDVTINAFEPGVARYLLSGAIDSTGLLNALHFNPQLRLQAASEQLQLDMSAKPVLATLEFIKP
ncbi:MAG: DUF2066 domain-containing protein [Gammaproteobacteria bacterium]|nr:DUF2066 domain-containing protein [Gammaproteobacteria bacterium]